MVQQPKNLDDEAVRAADSKAKGKMKEYADERANAKYSPVRVGGYSYSSAVMLKQA